MAQELWSELEHVLACKSENRPHFSAKRRLQILSKEMSAIGEWDSTETALFKSFRIDTTHTSKE
jgi:hypothetical protein